MNLVPLLLNVGNIIFFIATVPQLKLTLKNRHDLKDLSRLAAFCYMVACIAFLFGNTFAGALIAGVLNAVDAVYYALTIYWITKSRANTK